MLTIGSLFAGIGGFDLGLERTGHMRTVWFCEQDPYCQRVLAKHWPGVPIHGDVRTLVADTQVNGRGQGRTGRPDPDGARQHEPALQAELPVPVPYVDILTGGFPCQDLSYAGRGAGITGERSGLWTDYARLVRELRPRYVLVENVPALLARGMGRVLGDLAAVGYGAEWGCVRASDVGAPHRRDRIWIVAYPNADSGRLEVSGERHSDPPRPGFEASQRDDADGLRANVADAAWDLRTGSEAPWANGGTSWGGRRRAGRHGRPRRSRTGLVAPGLRAGMVART
jgi:DNA (cytosine-5)-methyltransferase 1